MNADPFQEALILTGPTGSGKSELALELAERLGAEIVSMDSMALYRGMDIGTAKPSREERQRVPHHLLDVLDPWQSASVAWWLEQAAACCREIVARGRRALIVGGTPLYLKAVVCGLFEGPPANEAIRQQLNAEAEQFGNEFLHARLARIDPRTARRLHRNDVRRVVRALEVWELTGKPISAWQQQWTKTVQSCSTDDQWPRVLCLDVPRPELYQRIDQRVERMIAAGWIEEVQALRQLPRPLSKEAAQALGYKEWFAYLDGQATLAETKERIQSRSRQFAKRQLTWFRHLPGCRFADRKLTFLLWGSKIEQ
ncbi:MAG: tRNA (adenosine(37)-N6)-dimethylallyltransferase MiaA [Gemmataceae bacterium]